MNFRMGRIDAESESDCSPTDRLPDARAPIAQIKERLVRNGFNT